MSVATIEGTEAPIQNALIGCSGFQAIETMPATKQYGIRISPYSPQFRLGRLWPVETSLKKRRISGAIAPTTAHQNEALLLILSRPQCPDLFLYLNRDLGHIEHKCEGTLAGIFEHAYYVVSAVNQIDIRPDRN